MSPIFVMFLALFIPGLVTVALIVLIALPRALRDDAQEQRLRTNHCPECGYDLRASDGPCPACGQFVSEVVRPAATDEDRPAAP